MKLKNDELLTAIELEFGFQSLKNMEWLSTSLNTSRETVRLNLIDGTCSPVFYDHLLRWMGSFRNKYARLYLSSFKDNSGYPLLRANAEEFYDETIHQMNHQSVLNYFNAVIAPSFKSIFETIEVCSNSDFHQHVIRLINRTTHPVYSPEEQAYIESQLKLMIEFGSRIEHVNWGVGELGFTLSASDWQQIEAEEKQLDCGWDKFVLIASIEYKKNFRNDAEELAKLVGAQVSLVTQWLEFERIPSPETEKQLLHLALEFKNPIAQKMLHNQLPWRGVELDRFGEPFIYENNKKRVLRDKNDQSEFKNSIGCLVVLVIMCLLFTLCSKACS